MSLKTYIYLIYIYLNFLHFDMGNSILEVCYLILVTLCTYVTKIIPVYSVSF